MSGENELRINLSRSSRGGNPKGQKDLTAYSRDQSSRLRFDYPEAENYVVLRVYSDNTADVRKPNWPDGVYRRKVPIEDVDGHKELEPDSTVVVKHTSVDRNRPRIHRLGAHGTKWEPLPVPPTPTPFPLALPLAGSQWSEFRRGPQRRSSSDLRSSDQHLWYYATNVTSSLIASTPQCSPVRWWGNRAFCIVKGLVDGTPSDTDAGLLSKIQGPFAPNRLDDFTPQEQCYHIRVAHQNITQGSTDGAVDQPGNGDPTDFINLRIWDLALSDAPGITWGGDVGLVPVDLSIQPYVERKDPLHDGPYPSFENPLVFEERVWLTVTWAAPSQQGPLGGRKCSRGRGQLAGYSEPSWKPGGPFKISRHLVNIRNTYTDTASDAIVDIEFHPFYKQSDPLPSGQTTSLSEVYKVWFSGFYVEPTATINGVPNAAAGIVEIQNRPCQKTVWVQNLSAMPLGTPIFRGEDPITFEFTTPDVITVLMGKTTTELSLDSETRCIEKISYIHLNGLTGVVTGSSDLPDLSLPDYLWEGTESNPGFFGARPAIDVGIFPYFTNSKLGEEYQFGLGLYKNAGYVSDFTVFPTGTEDSRGPKYFQRRESYSQQITGYRLGEDGSVSIVWEIQGWLSGLNGYRVFSSCGPIQVDGVDKLLIHFEEFAFQTATDGFGRGVDLIGLQAYEQAQGFPTPGSPDFFDVSQWPESGYDYAFQTDDPSGRMTNTGDLGIPTELNRLMDWPKTYWESRNDSTGWINTDTDYFPAVRKQGYIVADPATGYESEDYINVIDGTLSYPTGSLRVRKFISEPVPGAEESPYDHGADPATIDDVYGPVYDWIDPSVGKSGTGRFGHYPHFLDEPDRIRLLEKTWLVEYPLDFDEEGVSGYQDPIFVYATSLPSYDTGEPFGASGERRVNHSIGQHSSQVGVPADERFPEYGRRYATLIFDCDNSATMPYSYSEYTPWSPTKNAFINHVAAFLMTDRTFFEGGIPL